MFWGTLAAVAVALHLWLLMGRTCCSPAEAPACWGGRAWSLGNLSCVDPEPYLLVGHRNTILRIDLDRGDQELVVSGVGKSILLDFHYRAGRLYWVNIHTGVLSRADLDGSHRKKLLSLGKGVSGLAVDWIENSIYWSSRKRGMIQRADSDGKNKSTVLQDLSQPSSLVIDPNQRYLFWMSAGETPSIQRSDPVGGQRTTVLKVPDRLLALALDPVDRRLFWVQQGSGKASALGSCDYNGNLINVINQPGRWKSLKMSLFLDHLYLTDSASNSIARINKYMGGRPEKINTTKLLGSPTAVRVIHPINQPVAEVSAPLTSGAGCNPQTEQCVSVCSNPDGSDQCNCRIGFTLSKKGGYCEDINECALWNHGCSLGCENIPGSYFCTCPEGYLLLPDTKTCREIEPCVENGTLCDHACTHTQEGDVCVCPVGSTLKPDGRSCTGCLSADGGGCSQVCVTLSPGRWECECQPGYQLQPDGKQCKATGPPAFLLFANGVDIRRVSMDGSGSWTLLQDPEGSLRALDYDPVQNMVYFVSGGQKQIERISVDGGSRELLLSTGPDSLPEGLAVDWVNRKLYWTDGGSSSICCSNMNGQDTEVLISEKLLKPQAILVHPQAQKLFWTDVGSRPAVERSGLGGLGREVLVSAGLVTPSGLALDLSSQRLYWTDLTTGQIESARLDGSDRHTLTQNQVGRPFAVAVFEDSLWVSNWGDKQIYRLDKKTGLNPQRLLMETVQPAAITIIHPLTKPGSGDREWSDHLKNKTPNDESLPSDSGDTVAFTEKMVSDQDECFSLSCDGNAQCVLGVGGAICQCLNGFTKNGQICVDIDECSEGLAECLSVGSECVNTDGGYFCGCRSGFSEDGHQCKESKVTSRPTTGSPMDVTPPWRGGMESCPSTHDSFCLYNGVCLYFPEMESYGCNCLPGYIGERCQFSDLEWWELQQAEQEKRRNTAIAVCVALLILLLSIAASITYCYRCRRLIGVRPPVDSMSEASISEDSMAEASSNTPQFFVVLEHGGCNDGKVLHVVSCQRRTVCPSCSSETGESFVSEEAGTLKRGDKALDLEKCSRSPNLTRPEPLSEPCDNLISLDDPDHRPPQLL
ncbi:pro-epidermal growth factor isoform X2 [Astyanax mexicanus]|uniref:pro-epidermal growth factor isoform X2 n=1 Tax=Astyanax mexicanus TaxID=7994 RepID=UPI0020CABB96|nr:pro-epidermal growth factor isoform X2 [Astyanax mexicanus]